jgi:SRSO17 transposase
MSKVKVEGHTGLVKDTKTGAILNINSTEVEQARERKRLRKQKDKEFEDLKNEVGEIKDLLHKLIERL